MLIQVKMSSSAYNSSVPISGSYPPFYGTCNYYLHSNWSLNYPRFHITQTRISGTSVTIYEFFLDMGYGTSPGGVSPSRAIMFVNGTAPFVFDGTLLSNTTGGTVKYVTPRVLYSSLNNPPANSISGLGRCVTYTSLVYHGPCLYFGKGP